MARISTRKNTHSMAQTQTKVWISSLVASGLMRPMVNHMPTPVTAPTTNVKKTKNREWRLR